MRIWDIEPKYLSRQHLLGEHRELHAIWSILVNKKKGYSNHPEVLRWKYKLVALAYRHLALEEEIIKRGYKHNSDLKEVEFNFFQEDKQTEFINTIEEQKQILLKKNPEHYSQFWKIKKKSPNRNWEW